MSKSIFQKIVLVAVILAPVIFALWFFFGRVSWEIYISPRFGYLVEYPAGFLAREAPDGAPIFIISSSDNDFSLNIGVFTDKNVLSEEGFRGAMAAIKKVYDEDVASEVLLFDAAFHESESIRGDYTVAALFTAKSGVVYEQTEVGTIMDGGTVYILTFYVDRRFSDKYENLVKEIAVRFIPGEFRAVALR